MRRLTIKESDGFWHLTGTYLGQRVRRSTRLPADTEHQPEAELSRDRAERAIRESLDGRIVLARGARPVPERCLADAVADYVRSRSGATKSGNAVLRGVLEDFGPRPMKSIKPSEVQKWVVQHYGRPDGKGWRVKGSTLRTELGPLRRLFRLEYQLGHADRTLNLILPPDSPGRDVYLTVEEAQRVMDTEPAAVAPLFSFLLLTGARFSEAIRLTWDEISLSESWAVLTHNKGSDGQPKKRRIPLVRSLVGKLSALNHRDGPIFLNSYGRPHECEHPVKTVWHHWRKQREALGLSRVRLHDFRHTFASHLAMQGIELRKIADLLGHTTLNRTRQYAHLAPTALMEAVARLPY
jgi:integrase